MNILPLQAAPTIATTVASFCPNRELSSLLRTSKQLFHILTASNPLWKQRTDHLYTKIVDTIKYPHIAYIWLECCRRTFASAPTAKEYSITKDFSLLKSGTETLISTLLERQTTLIKKDTFITSMALIDQIALTSIMIFDNERRSSTTKIYRAYSLLTPFLTSSHADLAHLVKGLFLRLRMLPHRHRYYGDNEIRYTVTMSTGHFKKSAELGNLLAIAIMGSLYSNNSKSSSHAPNYQTALNWFTKGAKRGSVLCQKKVAILHKKGPRISSHTSTVTSCKNNIQPEAIVEAKRQQEIITFLRNHFHTFTQSHSLAHT